MAKKKKMLLIINPRSGKGQIRTRLLDILDIFIKAGYQVQVHVTQKAMDAKETVLRYGGGKELIVCTGGDGTLNETICGVLELPKKVVLGYIPAGSTNDFAASLKIPKQMLAAARAAALGEPYAVDVGLFCQERYFVYVAGFGAFTEVSYLTPQDKKNILGHQAYMLEGVRSLASLRSYFMEVEWDDNFLEGEFVFGVVTNTISVGGFKGLVTQSVALNDGEFEVLLIRNPRTPRDLSNIISYMFLKEEPNDYVFKFRAGHIRITSEEPVDWVLDGEFGGSRLEVEVENLKERIQILHSAERP